MCIRIMERACCVINISVYVNVHGYHEYKAFWDASVGKVPGSTFQPTRPSRCCAVFSLK